MTPLEAFINAIVMNTLWFGTITNTVDLSNGLCVGPSTKDQSTQNCVIGKVFELDRKGYVLVDSTAADKQKKGDMFYCNKDLCLNMK